MGKLCFKITTNNVYYDMKLFLKNIVEYVMHRCS